MRAWFSILSFCSLAAALGLSTTEARAQSVLFTFDDARLHSPLPIQVTAGGVTATLTGTGQNFSVQTTDVLGFTPVGFSGYCIYPNSVFAADLLVDFSQSITDFSILYAPEEYACDSSARMRVTAYLDGAYVGTATKTAYPPGTWPTATLRFTTNESAPFNSVVVHYDAPPPTGGDWGPIFMADNMRITPAGASVFSLGLSGTCPGRITASVTHATPGGQIALVYSLRSGSTGVPGCPGVSVDLNRPVIAGSFFADASGNGSFAGNVPTSACGRVLIQAVDRTGCQVSNVVTP